MEINADFKLRAVVHTESVDWVDSPMPGVQRRMIERIGDEVARATSVVKYAPDSAFSAHVHTGGEEFLVLDGVFEDEHGTYPTGSYIRNPPQSKHTPGSKPGCVILVKLWQFDLADRTPIVMNANQTQPRADPERPGVSVTPLFCDDRETVRIESWAPNVQAALETTGGAEVFVLDGGFEESSEHFRRHSWLRIPIGSLANLRADAQGLRIWVKSGHLKYASAPKLV